MLCEHDVGNPVTMVVKREAVHLSTKPLRLCKIQSAVKQQLFTLFDFVKLFVVYVVYIHLYPKKDKAELD